MESLTLRDSEAPPLLGFLSPEKASEVEAEGAGWVGCEGLSQCLWLGGGWGPFVPLAAQAWLGLWLLPACSKMAGSLVSEDAETRGATQVTLSL